VFHNVDLQGDVIVPGAFKNLDAFVRSGWGAVNHNNWGSDLGIAYIESAIEDAHGLKVVAKFHSTPDAQAVRTKVRERLLAGKDVQCSFGFRVLDAAQEVRDGKTITVLTALEAFEFSVVNLAANPRAGVVAAKGQADGLISPEDAIGLVKMLVKEGRTLSRQNVATVRDWAARCRAAADEMDALAGAFDKDTPAEDALASVDPLKSIEPTKSIESPAPPDSPNPPNPMKSLRIRALRLRASSVLQSEGPRP
jgi:HK97 family phage prohead protease